MLGAETKNAEILQNIYQEQYGELRNLPNRMWSRLVLKYWFIDEAATGVEHDEVMPKVSLDDLDISRGSLHLSARPSGTKSGSASFKRAKSAYPEFLTSNNIQRGPMLINLPPPPSESVPLDRWSQSSLGRRSQASMGRSHASSIGSIAERLLVSWKEVEEDGLNEWLEQEWMKEEIARQQMQHQEDI